MAIKGLSMLIVGMYDYSGTGNKPTYSEPATVAKMVEYSLAINQSEDNPLYADDMDAEHDKGTFQNGELSLTTDDLTQEASKRYWVSERKNSHITQIKMRQKAFMTINV